MQAKSSLPAPFSQNRQYKKRQAADGDDDDDDHKDGTPPAESAAKAKKSVGSKSKLKKKNTKKAPAQLSKVKRVDTDTGGGEHLGSEGQSYKPHDYSLARKTFINNLKAEGVSPQDAAEQWNASAQKRSMLSTLSVQELKRRRFVAKTCQENPWAD